MIGADGQGEAQAEGEKKELHGNGLEKATGWSGGYFARAAAPQRSVEFRPVVSGETRIDGIGRGLRYCMTFSFAALPPVPK
jgi:hypothetical protein